MMYLFISTLITFGFLNPQEDWKKEVDKNNVQVYTKKVEGYPIKAFRATSIINSGTDQIIEKLMDIENYSQWVANVSSTSIISVVNDSLLYFYMEVAAPFPVEDRDLVQSSELVKVDEKTIELRITNHPQKIEPKQGFIRMPKSDGKWTLTILDSSQTLVQLEMMNDPGGTLPDWLVNSMITGSPYKTMNNLRKFFAD